MSLTPTEHEAVEMAAGLYLLVRDKIIGDGPTRNGDLDEIAGHIHAIQNAVLAQSAAREYPDRYRLMGEDRP